MSGNAHDAEDITQETFIRVFRSLDNYRPGSFEGWLHRITTNVFLDMVRRRQRIRMEALPEETDRIAGREPSPEQAFSDANLDPDLQAALDDLLPEFRAAVVLCDVEGLTYEEIGATLGVKLGTVRSRIHRGRLALRSGLGTASERERADRDWFGGGAMTAGFGDHLNLDAIVAFADGEMPMVAFQRAAAHVARCPQCENEVNQQIAARSWLRSAEAPAMPLSLLDSLRSIPVAMPAEPSGRTARPSSRTGRAVRRSDDHDRSAHHRNGDSGSSEPVRWWPGSRSAHWSSGPISRQGAGVAERPVWSAG